MLLIEAGSGKGRHMNVTIPAAFAKQFKTKLDWELYTEPEPGCDGRSLYFPRGKGLGGSSSMNAMLYVRGRPLDYDLWEQQGATGWGWDGVKPYFLKSEDNERGPSEYHAVGGELNVADERSPRALTETFLVAAEAAGHPAHRRLQRPRAGRRRARPGDAEERQALEHRRGLPAPGDEAPEPRGRHRRPGAARRHRGRPRDGRALPRRRRDEGRPGARGIILAAGAYGSPQILMLSGIGPAEQLREVGVPRPRRPARASARTSRTTRTWSGSGTPGGGSLADAEHPKYLLEWLLRRPGR